jgi:membrane associated rhomboid family serine protease
MMIGRGGWSSVPPVVKNLLIINGLMFLAAFVFQQSIGFDFWEEFGLHYFSSDKFHPYQIVTYMFMHGSISHIFFNMFAVWMFGTAIENVWGSKRFLTYYLLTGFGAALLHYGIIYLEISPVLDQLQAIIDSPTPAAVVEFADSNSGISVLRRLKPQYYDYFISLKNGLIRSPEDATLGNEMSLFMMKLNEMVKDGPNIVGASGSLFGILLAFGMMFPNMRLMLLFPPIPIKAKFLVIGYGAMELYSAFQNNPNDNVAHFAHLGGMLFGFLIIKFWEKTGQRWR